MTELGLSCFGRAIVYFGKLFDGQIGTYLSWIIVATGEVELLYLALATPSTPSVQWK